MRAISVKNLLSHAGEKLLARVTGGEDGLGRNIRNRRIFVLKRAQELNRLNKETAVVFITREIINDIEKDQKLFTKLEDSNIAMLVIEDAETPPKKLIKWCDSHNIPLINTSLSEQKFIPAYHECLNHCIANIRCINGVLIDVNGVGVLLTGKSSIGKSEVALDLIIKGHRLVADDVVEIFRDESGELFGTAPDITAQHMEIRGLGIIDVSKVFGISSIRVRKKIEMVIELAHKELHQIDRLGEKKFCTILGKKLPKIIIPVSPGRNIATLVEVSARLYLLEMTGYKPLVDFKKTLKEKLKLERIKI